jgi:hypothetical protein
MISDLLIAASMHNIPAVLFRDTPEGQEWMNRHGS